MKLQRPGNKRCIFFKKIQFACLSISFLLSSCLSAVPLFLSWRESLHWPPSAVALRLRQRSRSEGRDLSLWPMGGCFLQVCRAPCSIFFGAVDFGSSRNAKKKHAERKLSGSWLRRNRTRFFSYVDLVRIDSFATHHCSLVNLSYRSTVSFIVTPHD